MDKINFDEILKSMNTEDFKKHEETLDKALKAAEMLSTPEGLAEVMKFQELANDMLDELNDLVAKYLGLYTESNEEIEKRSKAVSANLAVALASSCMISNQLNEEEAKKSLVSSLSWGWYKGVIEKR